MRAVLALFGHEDLSYLEHCTDEERREELERLEELKLDGATLVWGLMRDLRWLRQSIVKTN